MQRNGEQLRENTDSAKICKHSINFEQEKRQFDEQITKLHEEQINETVISEIN